MYGKKERGLDYTPLFRFLISKVGSNWNEVLSEAKSRLDKTKQIFWLVALDENDKEANNFAVDFFVASNQSSNFMPTLCGENGIYAVIELAKKYNRQIYHSENDGMVDRENPDTNGFKNHRKYVEQIMNCKS